MSVSSIDDETKLEVEKDVIGYNGNEIDLHLIRLLDKLKNKK